MANDIDMYNDIMNIIDEKEAELLNECYNAKFVNNDGEQAEYLKNLFEKEYGYWGGWY
jgi:hypothetical protein